MRRLALVVTTLTAALAACGTTPNASPPTNNSVTALAQNGAASSGKYIVVFQAATLPTDAAAIIEQAGGRLLRAIPEIGVASAAGNTAFAARLARARGVLSVGSENAYLSPDDPLAAGAEVFEPAEESGFSIDDASYWAQWNIRRIGAPAAWERGVKGKGVTVAVIDVGVASDHPDLAGQVVYEKATNLCPVPEIYSEHPAYPYYTQYVDLVTHPEWTPEDGCVPEATTRYDMHGTFVSGVVAAKIGGGEVVGVAPEASIAAYKIFDRIRDTDPTLGPVVFTAAFEGPLFAAIVDAANQGFPIINLSLGGTRFHNAGPEANAGWVARNRVIDYATRKGTLVVTAALNGATASQGPIAFLLGDVPRSLNVSATGTASWLEGQDQTVAPGLTAESGKDVLAYYSNYGNTIDITAPGGDCGLDETGTPWCRRPDGGLGVNPKFALHRILSSGINATTGQLTYLRGAGTSASAPHVAGVAALVKSQHPDWSPVQVRAQLQSTADTIGSRQFFGHGLVNADAATR